MYVKVVISVMTNDESATKSKRVSLFCKFETNSKSVKNASAKMASYVKVMELESRTQVIFKLFIKVQLEYTSIETRNRLTFR